MIGRLSGTIVETRDSGVVIDVGGVGYLVHVSSPTHGLLALGDSIELWIHTAVREDAIDLYGFNSEEEYTFFTLLIGISGIGPKSALSILSLAPPKTLREAISSGKASYLTKVSGIGKKNAEKIVLELKDKVAQVSDGSMSDTLASDVEALDGLKALGYSTQEARGALAKVPGDVESTSERIRAALKHLGSH